MKKLIPLLILSLTLLLFSQRLFSQKMLTEGTVVYNISIQSGKSENAIANNLSGAELKIYLKPTVSRTEMVNNLGVESTVFDSKLGKGFILKEYSGQKLMITANKLNWNQKNQWNNNLKFSIEDKITIINGYNCKKASATTADGRNFEVYFTPDIIPANKDYNNSFDQLPGLPVQYELRSGNLTIRHTLSRINYDALANSLFEAPRSGYRIMTYEENQQLRKEGK